MVSDPFAPKEAEQVKDTDMSFDSPHHTLGVGSTQAAAGNHKHPDYLEPSEIKAGQNITVTSGTDGSITISGVDTPTGLTDHGALSGLYPDDDHPQYLNEGRGDERYAHTTGDNAAGTWPINIQGNSESVNGQVFHWDDRGRLAQYFWVVDSYGDSYLMYLGTLDGRYAGQGAPSEVGITVGTWNVGTLGPGAEAQVDVAKPAGSAVFVTVQHNSTFIYAVANTISTTVVRLRCRNGTTSTTHGGIGVYYMFVPNV